MLEDEDQPPRKGSLRLRHITAVAFIAALLYVGWVFFSRWEANRELVARQARQQAQEDARTVQAMGAEKLEIRGFYPDPAYIERGQSAQLCYGVSDARDVRIEPHVDNVWPSYSRCVTVSPAQDTTYTLIATDAAGHSVTSKTTLHVR